MTRVFRHLLIVFVITFLVSSCATTIAPTALIPPDNETYQSTGKTLRVLPVKIGERLKPGWTDPLVTFPEASIYRDAVISTLQTAGMFTEVSKEGLADYTLSTEVVGERMLGSMNNVAFILIRYELVETETQSSIWTENIFSHFEISAAEVFIAVERLEKALEGVIRNNLEQLDNKIAIALTVPQN